VAAKVNAVIAGSEVDRAFAPLRGITGVSKNTVSKLAVDADKACAAYQADKACAAYQADKACAAYQDRVLRNLPCKRVQLGEVWNFVYAKEANLATARAAPDDAGDIYLVGRRDTTTPSPLLMT
jgi:hypothetical protein